MISKIIIFTDLDGTLLHSETFEFENIRQYIKNLLSKNISIIPNSSKTKAEILNFCHELKEELPFIAENGAAIYKMNLINSDFPEKIILSRDKDEILNVFLKKTPKKITVDAPNRPKILSFSFLWGTKLSQVVLDTDFLNCQFFDVFLVKHFHRF